MVMLEAILSAVGATIQPKVLLSLAAGTAAGILGGAIPGVTITMTIVLALPFTFGMDSLQGLATMIGIYVGGSAGGLVATTLLGIPGTPSAIATTFDGFPMARRGEPGRAVWLGIWASFFGGLIAWFPLVVGATALARVALKFGPWEYFSLFVLALSIVAGLAEASLLKGLIASTLGLLITTVGSDPIMGIPRLTFGSESLRSGFPFLAVLIGVYTFSQLLGGMTEAKGGERGISPAGHVVLTVSHRHVIKEILQQPLNLLRSSVIGLWIGLLPAVGGSAANLLAYDQAKKGSRHPERFGTGIPDGIIASESSNNANVGGSLITMMAFGIPGDAITAVMLGALIIHGIQPGPLFVTTHTGIAYGMFIAYLLAHPMMIAIQWALLKLFTRIVTVPRHVLIPVIIVLCVIGSYAVNNIMANVWTFFVFGILGYLMVKLEFPLAPFILGAILGNQIEINLIRAIMADPNPLLFITRPLSGFMLFLAVVSVGVSLYQRRKRADRQKTVRPGVSPPSVT